MTVDTDHRLPALDETGRSLLFSDARTANSFADVAVSDAELAEVYELAKMGPSAANLQPMRVLFVRTPEGKERLAAHMAEGNRAKTLSAPAVAVLAYDSRFHEHIPTVFPIRPEMQEQLEGAPEMREGMGRFSATLQIGTFIMAARAAGLATGPMAGFDAAGIDAEFFADGRWKTLLVVNLGHPGENPWFDRLPRLDADTAVDWA